MTITDWSVIGEIVSAIAVVISLIYVGVQVKQNTTATRVVTTQAHVESWNHVVSNLCQSSETASNWHQGLQDLSRLEGGQRVQFFAQLSLVNRYYEASYLEWVSGVLDERLWSGLRAMLVDSMSYPGAREWWNHRRHHYCADYQQLVDTIFAAGSGRPLYGSAGSVINTDSI